MNKQDQHSRMSYLYQASMLLGTQTDELGLARQYASTIRSISQKNVLRVHPHIKRTICKRCDTPFVYGKTCRVSYEISSAKKPELDRVLRTCAVCGATKRFSDRPAKKRTKQGQVAQAELNVEQQHTK
ncbi:RNase P subunit Rpr2 [Schizosaccharomyces japonicus yFS275]|uniref:RNase P subunit Rpr2 n=1 Tax=Schizosaccharomyces japonicus (strain yFS275 / FY16936) TaxID=402676 RepID=B6JV99_SCHJY|nr:RNase P subunit Rpr2 [Schizosaccharomyces japonicus yFS275]EEB05300.1 RNase P subunit Rpr2 [Schizosaccharomyces japonicus yFS275]